MNLKLSVITPSYNSLRYLKLCVSSVASQEVAAEHIVVDGGSSDGTVEWLEAHHELQFISERDQGMYDAINKGLIRSTGDVVGYLNCDEQYLAGTLAYVKAFFEANADVDIISGNALLVDDAGQLLAFRKGHVMRWPYIFSSHLYVLTCSIFFRRRILEDGFEFDKSWRAVGDIDFAIRVLRRGYKAAHCNKFFSVFTMTGENLGNTELATKELVQLKKQAPLYIRLGAPLLNLFRYAEKVINRNYFEKMPIRYEIFVDGDSSGRRAFSSAKSSFRWPR